MRQMMCMWVGVRFGVLRSRSLFLLHREEMADPVPFILRYYYKIAREYNWNVKNKASKGYEENYFFIFREGDGVYYNELETRYLALSYLTEIIWACTSDSGPWGMQVPPRRSFVPKDLPCAFVRAGA